LSGFPVAVARSARRGASFRQAMLPGRGIRARRLTRLVREIRLGEIETIRGGADQPVRVEIEAFTDPDGREYAPTIRVTLSSASSPDPDADDLTPAEARELAGALLEAAASQSRERDIQAAAVIP